MGLRRGTPFTTCSGSSSIWDWKGGGSSALLQGADPRTEQRAPTLEPAHPNRKVKPALVSGFLPVLVGRAGVSFPGSGLSFFFSGPCVFSVCFFFLLLLLSFGRGRHVSSSRMGGTSGQTRGHRPKKRYRSPTQGPAFPGTTQRTSFLCTSLRLS